MNEQIEQTLSDSGVPAYGLSLGQLPPHDLYAEESVVASLLIDGEAMEAVSKRIAPGDFYGEKTRPAFEAQLALYQRGESINLVSVAHKLAECGKFEQVGGNEFLRHLYDTQAVSVHAEHYAGIVERCARQRDLISVYLDAIENVTAPELAVWEYAELVAERSLTAAPRPADLQTRHNMESANSLMLANAMNAHKHRIPTFLWRIDELLHGGFTPGMLAVLAAPSGTGKSMLSGQWAYQWANHGKRVFIQSYEMTPDQLSMRHATRALRATEDEITAVMRNEPEAERNPRSAELADGFLDWAADAAGLPIVSEHGPLTVDELCAAVRREKRHGGVDVVLVDHLQEMPSAGKTDNRNTELDRASTALKHLATTENVFVLAMSQVNREAEKSNGPLSISAIRDSGGVGQSADVVLTMRVAKTQPDPERVKVDLHMAKNRGGADNVTLALEREGRFANFQVWESEDSD